MDLHGFVTATLNMHIHLLDKIYVEDELELNGCCPLAEK